MGIIKRALEALRERTLGVMETARAVATGDDGLGEMQSALDAQRERNKRKRARRKARGER